ncbi:hypothetical protein QTP86_004619 [Hemibagrus guttatus]|nr:hypothetical protein QTP86_004619 [Hemibagrus guttatus]
MKSGKAVGPDDIPVEVWKCLGEAAVESLASLFNRVLESERMPEEWRRSVLVPIFKNKGDVQSCSNYRGIKLMSHTMKLWERVVEARLRKVVEICEQQYGFMPRKSTTDAIFALRILMEKYRDGQRELHCVFVDLEKAYDRVPREELWYCMRKSGVAEKYVRVVQDMYERSRTVVKCAVGQTEEFKVEVGLHQGSALSPFLFAIVMDQLSEEVRQESPWTMMFADDIVICSESREQVEENLERWRFALERRGMKVSRSKTEYMCVNERKGSGTVRLQGEEVKKVQKFKYLGSTVQSNGECGKERECPIAKFEEQRAKVRRTTSRLGSRLTFEPTSSNPVIEHKVGNQYEASFPELTQAQIQFTQTGDVLPGTPNEEEDELFKDVDPKTLAAVLLEALNNSQEPISKQEKKEVDNYMVEEDRETPNFDRERNGDQELELVRAAAEEQGREEREREQDEQRKREEEEEELLTERVTSHTTSQTVPVNEQEVVAKEVASKEEQETEGLTDRNKNEQLSPEELKNLETMLEEFQSYSTATKRERDSSSGQRESRGDYFDYLDRNGLMNNEIKPKPKGYDLALSKKKLKWQQEQEKNKNRPLYKGGNFMDDFNDNIEDQEQEDGEDEEELLSPEEEEARAKAEQEEVRRQAAEAQRAKAEEEKLADIASDMILQYMVKQDGKKYRDNNAAEDKRSEEDGANDDDDIDPQTIDKLIEISSKLHLPADDVVDIISDVEKKKKKDAPETLQWQRPLVPPPAPDVPSSVLRASSPSKPPKPNTNVLKSWFKERASIKPSKQDFWIKQQWPFWTYPSYRRYQKPYNSYYTIYMPPPQPKPRYYAKPSYSLNDILRNSLDYDYPLKQRYLPWTQSRQRAPLAFRRNLYFPNYIVPQPRTFKGIPIPKPRSPLRHRPAYFYSPTASVVAPPDSYYSQMEQPQPDSNEELGNFIEKVFLKRPRMFQ